MPRVFISYRRADSSGSTGRIYDHLTDHFKRDDIFIDVDNIPLGVNFADYIDDYLSNCDALLAIIGREWLTVTEEDGTRRLDNPNDYTRIEVATALRRNILVIPVLVDGAIMPHASELPKPLAELSARNALSINHSSFYHDVGKLISRLAELDAPPKAKPKAPATPKAEPIPKKPSPPAAQKSAAPKPQASAPPVSIPKSPEPVIKQEAPKPASTVNLDRLYLQNPKNAAFLRDESRYLKTGAGTDIVVAIGIGIMFVAIFSFGVFSFAGGKAGVDPGWLIGGSVIFIGLPLAGLFVTVSRWLAQRRLAQQGRLCDGTITSSREFPDPKSKNNQYTLELKINFPDPAGTMKVTTITKQIAKPLGAALPAVGTPVKVLYLDNQHLEVL